MIIRKKRFWDFIHKKKRGATTINVVALPGESIFCGEIDGQINKYTLSKVICSVIDLSLDLEFTEKVKYITSDNGKTREWEDYQVGNEIGKLIRRLNGESISDHKYEISTTIDPREKVYQVENNRVVSHRVLDTTLHIDEVIQDESLYICFDQINNNYGHLNIKDVFLSKEEAYLSLEKSIKR